MEEIVPVVVQDRVSCEALTKLPNLLWNVLGVNPKKIRN
jgi:hypothetical protein